MDLANAEIVKPSAVPADAPDGPADADEAAMPDMAAPDSDAAHVAIPFLDGIDTADGLANHLDSPSLYLRSLAGFNRDCGNSAEEIVAALANDDYALARRLAHTLKSVAAIIGAHELAGRAKLLEERCAAGEPAEAEFAVCAEELRRVSAALRPFDAKPDAAEAG